AIVNAGPGAMTSTRSHAGSSPSVIRRPVRFGYIGAGYRGRSREAFDQLQAFREPIQRSSILKGSCLERTTCGSAGSDLSKLRQAQTSRPLAPVPKRNKSRSKGITF